MEQKKYGFRYVNSTLVKMRSNPMLIQLAWISFYALSGFAAATAKINEHYAPFGVILAASAGSIPVAIAAGVGSFLGYLSIWGQVDSLKYISALIIISCIRMFFPEKSEKDRYFMPYISCSTLSVVGFVFLSSKGINIYDFSMFITESALCLFLCGLFHDTLPSLFDSEKKDETSLLGAAALGGIVLLSTMQVSLPFEMTLGGVLSCIVLLSAAYYGNMGASALCAVVTGAIMAAGGRVESAFSMGVSAVIASMFSKRSRFAASAMFVLCNATAMIWFSEAGALISSMYEVFFGSVCFIVAPVSLSYTVGKLWIVPKTDATTTTGKLLMGLRLRYISQGFESLSRAMSPEDNIEKLKFGIDTAKSFDYAADSVCRKCTMALTCWQKDSSYTYNCLCDSAPKIMNKIEARQEHFPSHFVEKCKKIDDFIEAINQNLILQKKTTEKVVLNPTACGFISSSFHELAESLKNIPEDDRFTPYAPIQDKLEMFFLKNPTYSQGGAAVMEDGVLYISLFCEWKEINQNLAVKELSEAVGRELEPVYSSTYPMFREPLPENAEIAFSARKRAGERESGDFFLSFEQGNLMYMVMVDGMGSGRMAAAKSRAAANIIKCYLKAGMPPETALQAIDSSLFLKENGSFFVTADITVIDRKNGQCDIYKTGSPPTFIRRGDKVVSSGANGLPLGLGGKIYHRRHRVQRGAFIVMLTDGITLCEDREEWKKLLLSLNDIDSQKVADMILDRSQIKEGRRDDMTVAVAVIK